MTNSTLSSNSATDSGGGIYNNVNVTARLSNCTLVGNVATNSGGGIYNSRYAKTSLANCTLSGNTATTSGGGIYNNDGGKIQVASSTLSGNAAAAGGGLFANASRFVHFRNTIFANSTSGGSCAGARVQLHGMYNLDDSGTCGIRGQGCPNRTGQSLCNIDPKLDPAGLADNGGPTQTIAVQSDSPAIHAAFRCLPTDQRTFARLGINPATSRPFRFCTIGAYEFNSQGCRPEYTLCTGTCADLQKDPGNCGACGTICAVGQKCSKGVCK